MIQEGEKWTLLYYSLGLLQPSKHSENQHNYFAKKDLIPSGIFPSMICFTGHFPVTRRTQGRRRGMKQCNFRKGGAEILDASQLTFAEVIQQAW